MPSAVATPEKPAIKQTISPVLPTKISVEAYFEMERTSEMRHEYVEGLVIPMPGESLAHNRIALNLSTTLDRAFEERTCQVFMEGIRLRVSPVNYRYPDVIALCGEPLIDTDNPPCLLNPMLIGEVLSTSTRATDFDEKLREYQRLPDLTDYLLIEQDHVFVTHYTRQNETQWLQSHYSRLEDILTFKSLDTSLPLETIYRKVVLTKEGKD